MRGILESSQVFRWQRVQLHIAPEGLAITRRRGLSSEADVHATADFNNVIAAEVVGRGRKALLRIQFSDSTPAWEISRIAEAEGHWAAELIRSQIGLIHRSRSPEFKSRIEFDAMQPIADRLIRSPERATIDLVDFILFQAVFHRASDVHFDSISEYGDLTDNGHLPAAMIVRYRIDGTLRDVLRLALPSRESIINRLKAAAQLSAFRSDVPQEGRLVINVGDRNVDLRLTSVPTLHGEKIAVRVFDPAVGLVSLDSLGMENELRQRFEQVISRPQGLVLLTGPSGSGKTTTLYAALDWIRTRRGDVRLIATVEDPIEFDLKVVSQTQVNHAIGLDFAAGLRTVLRQDPQVIMVGEIRDLETADTAVRAGLTGHLIASTVHALSASGVFVRLADIGVEPYLVASSVTAVLAQRLVRTICGICRENYQPDHRLLERIRHTATSDAFVRGRGCPHCAGSGYLGRTGLFELIETTDTMRDLIMRRAPLGEFERAAATDRTSSMLDQGLAKVASRMTTLEELERVGVLMP